ncbi:MAG: hypothetical protein H8D47_01230 [Planctomycetes bacterium]|nr:hypothetical protein [Planctomycetota bacterium]
MVFFRSDHQDVQEKIYNLYHTSILSTTRCFLKQMMEYKPRKFSDLIARFIHYVHLPNDFTVDPLTLGFPTAENWPFKDMYIVSLYGHEQRFFRIPRPEELAAWVNMKLPLLRQGYFVGGWLKDRQYYLDVSTVVYGYKHAMTIAESNSQKAIYYPFKNEVIPVDISKMN